jgi:hypothetical protein
MLPCRVNCEHKDRPRGLAKCEHPVSERLRRSGLLEGALLRARQRGAGDVGRTVEGGNDARPWYVSRSEKAVANTAAIAPPPSSVLQTIALQLRARRDRDAVTALKASKSPAARGSCALIST